MHGQIRVSGIIHFFFVREGKWDARTMHLLSFAISARNVAITPKKKSSVRGGGGGNP